MPSDFYEEDMARLQVDVPEDLKTQAKVEALQEGITLSQLVERALKEHLEKLAKKK